MVGRWAGSRLRCERVGELAQLGLGPQPGEELADLAPRAGEHVEQLGRDRPRAPGEQLADAEQRVAAEDREGDGGAQVVGADGVAAEDARIGPEVLDDDRFVALPHGAGQSLAADEGAEAGVGLQRRHRLPGRRPRRGVGQAAAARLGLPERGGVPVQLGAQRGQQPLERDVGVRRLGQRRGDAEGGGEVAADLQLALEPDGGGRVAQHGDATPRRRARRRRPAATGSARPAPRTPSACRAGSCVVEPTSLPVRVARKRAKPGRVRRPEPLGDQHGQRRAAQLGRVVAQQRGGRPGSCRRCGPRRRRRRRRRAATRGSPARRFPWWAPVAASPTRPEHRPASLARGTW